MKIKTNFALNELINFAQQHSLSQFIDSIYPIFGHDIPDTAIQSLYDDLLNNQLSTPNIKIVNDDLGNHIAAYDTAKSTILVAETAIQLATTSDQSAWHLKIALAEEFGHHIDDLLRNHYSNIGGDAALDEGALFARQILTAETEAVFATIDSPNSFYQLSTTGSGDAYIQQYLSNLAISNDQQQGNLEFAEAPTHQSITHDSIADAAGELGYTSEQISEIQNDVYAGNLLMDISQVKTDAVIDFITEGLIITLEQNSELKTKLEQSMGHEFSRNDVIDVIDRGIRTDIAINTGYQIPTGEDAKPIDSIPSYDVKHHLDNPLHIYTDNEIKNGILLKPFNKDFVNQTLENIKVALLHDKDPQKARMLLGQAIHGTVQDMPFHSNGILISLAEANPDIITYAPEANGRTVLVTGTFEPIDTVFSLVPPVVDTVLPGHNATNTNSLTQENELSHIETIITNGLEAAFPELNDKDINELIESTHNIPYIKEIFEAKETIDAIKDTVLPDYLENILKEPLMDLEDSANDLIRNTSELIPLVQNAYFDETFTDNNGNILHDSPTHSMIAWDHTDRKISELATILAKEASTEVTRDYLALEESYKKDSTEQEREEAITDLKQSLNYFQHPQDNNWIKSEAAKQWLKDNPETIERLRYRTGIGYEVGQLSDYETGRQFENNLLDAIKKHGTNTTEALDYYKQHPEAFRNDVNEAAQKMPQDLQDQLESLPDLNSKLEAIDLSSTIDKFGDITNNLIKYFPGILPNTWQSGGASNQSETDSSGHIESFSNGALKLHPNPNNQPETTQPSQPSEGSESSTGSTGGNNPNVWIDPGDLDLSPDVKIEPKFDGGDTIYENPLDGSKLTIKSDGTTVFEFPDNGPKVTIDPNSLEVKVENNENNTSVWEKKFGDGTVVQVDKDGNVIISQPDIDLGNPKIDDLPVDGIRDPFMQGNQNSNRRIPRDPLVLDLDGDGIELTDLNASNAYFDLDGNGFATHSSWVSSDDGFLAMDRNNDGTINDINELFGDTTQHGFEELSTLDTNQDGLIDLNDEQFNELLVWQDSNGDGISQAQELKSLSDHNITSINLNAQAVPGQLNSDGQIISESSFTRVDGSSGTISESSGIAADIDLLTDPTFSRFTGAVTIDESVVQVGNIKGYGLIPDLHIAMSLDSGLKQQVLDLSTNLNANNVHAAFDSILIKWAGVENITSTDIDSTPNLTADEQGMVHFNNAGVSLSLQQLGIIKKYIGINEMQLDDGQWRSNGQILTTGQFYKQAWENLYRDLLSKFVISNDLLNHAIRGIKYDPETDHTSVEFDIESSATQLFDYVFDVISTYPQDETVVNNALLTSLVLLEIEPLAKNEFIDELQAFLTNTDITANNWLISNPLVQLLPVDNAIGTSDNNSMTGTGNDTLSGGDGNDNVQGQDGNDTLFGDAGDDALAGQNGNDVLDGGAGRDRINGGNGDDRLSGGTGSGDSLSGDAGNDTYLFAAGDGSDTVYNYDTNAASVDKIRFENVSIEDLWFSRSGSNLQVTIAGTDDQVMISNWYSNANYQLDHIELGSSTLLNSQVDQLVTAMASYSVPNGVGNVIPQEVKDELQPVLAQTWQTL